MSRVLLIIGLAILVLILSEYLKTDQKTDQPLSVSTPTVQQNNTPTFTFLEMYERDKEATDLKRRFELFYQAYFRPVNQDYRFLQEPADAVYSNYRMFCKTPHDVYDTEKESFTYLLGADFCLWPLKVNELARDKFNWTPEGYLVTFHITEMPNIQAVARPNLRLSLRMCQLSQRRLAKKTAPDRRSGKKRHHQTAG